MSIPTSTPASSSRPPLRYSGRPVSASRPVTVTPAVPWTIVTLDDADGDDDPSEAEDDPHAVSTRAADRARAAAAAASA